MTLSLVVKILNIVSGLTSFVGFGLFVRLFFISWTARRELARLPGQGGEKFPLIGYPNPDLFFGRGREYALQVRRGVHAVVIACLVDGLCRALASFLERGAATSLSLSPQAKTMLALFLIGFAVGGAGLFVYSGARGLADLMGHRLRGTPVRGMSPLKRFCLAGGALVVSASAAILFGVHTGKLS